VKDCVTVAPEPSMGFIRAQERCTIGCAILKISPSFSGDFLIFRAQNFHINIFYTLPLKSWGSKNSNIVYCCDDKAEFSASSFSLQCHMIHQK